MGTSTLVGYALMISGYVALYTGQNVVAIVLFGLALPFFLVALWKQIQLWKRQWKKHI